MEAYNNSVVLRNDGVDPSTNKVDLNAGLGVLVTVRVANATPGAGALASIFDLAEVVTANPVTSDDNGNYSFKANDGQYDIVVAEGTGDQYIIAAQSIVDTSLLPLELINDLSQAYEFKTIDEFKSSSVIFPVGKDFNLKERSLDGGGGAKWFNVLTSTVTPNGMDIVQSTQVPTQSAVLVLGSWNGGEGLLAFGATGLGVIDETAIVNRMISVMAPQGLTVRPGKGTFLIDPSISILMDYSGLKFIGEGKRNTNFLAKYNVAGSVFKRTFKSNIAISGINQSNPAFIATVIPHGLTTGDVQGIAEVVGMTEINGLRSVVTVLSPTTFEMNTIDSTGFGGYVSGGITGGNVRVDDVEVRDFSVFMNHLHQPTPVANVQIAMNMGSISRTVESNIYTGNFRYGLAETLFPNAANNTQAMRGYGFAYSTVSGSDPGYAGGEVHNNKNCKVWWAKKGPAIDDIVLTGGISAAYKTVIDSCDIQTVEIGIAQESGFNTGCTFKDNLIQDLKNAAGSADDVGIYYIEGYENRVTGGYVETAESDLDYGIRLGTVARNNVIEPFYHEISDAKFLLDEGNNQNNSVNWYSHPSNSLREFYNKAPKASMVKFYWDGANIIYEGGLLSTNISRVGLGDYLINFAFPYRDEHYGFSFGIDTDASGNAGMITVQSATTSNIRVACYSQIGSVTALVDPRHIWVTITRTDA